MMKTKKLNSWCVMWLAFALALPVTLFAQDGKRPVALVSVGTKEVSFVPPATRLEELPATLKDTAFGHILPLVPAFFQGEMGCYKRFFTILKQGETTDETLHVKLVFSDVENTVKSEKDHLGVQFQVIENSLTMNLTVTEGGQKVLLSRNFTYALKRRLEENSTPEALESEVRQLVVQNLRIAAKVISQAFTCNYKIAVKALPKGSDFEPAEAVLFCDDDPVFLNESFRVAKGKHKIHFIPGQGYAEQEINVEILKDSKTTFELLKE